MNRRTARAAATLFLALAGACAGGGGGAASPPPSTVEQGAAGYVRMLRDYEIPGLNLVLYAGQIYRRVDPRTLDAEYRARYEMVHLFQGRAAVPRTHAEPTSSSGSLPYEYEQGSFLSDVRSALTAVHNALKCRRGKDTLANSGREERLTNELLARVFRQHRADPSRYEDIRGSVQPHALSYEPAECPENRE